MDRLVATRELRDRDFDVRGRSPRSVGAPCGSPDLSRGGHRGEAGSGAGAQNRRGPQRTRGHAAVGIAREPQRAGAPNSRRAGAFPRGGRPAGAHSAARFSAGWGRRARRADAPPGRPASPGARVREPRPGSICRPRIVSGSSAVGAPPGLRAGAALLRRRSACPPSGAGRRRCARAAAAEPSARSRGRPDAGVSTGHHQSRSSLAAPGLRCGELIGSGHA